MKRFCRALFIGVLVISSAAMAQELSEEGQNALQRVSAADGQSAAISLLDVATIEAGTSDTKASINFAGFVPDAGTGSWYQMFSIGGDAAVSKGSTDDAVVGTLSGLNKGSSARASFSWIHWERMGTSEVNTREAFCQKRLPEFIGGHTWEDAGLGGGDAGCDSGLFTEARIKELADGLEAARKLCVEGKSKLSAAQCGRLTAVGEIKPKPVAELKAALDRAQKDWRDLERRLETGVGDRPAYIIAVGTRVNRAKANYFLETDLSTLVKDHTTGYGGTVSVSRYFDRQLLSAGFSMEKSYKGNDEVEVCSPVAGTTALRCISGAIGAPKHSYARIAHAEMRWLSPKGRIAVAPRMEYDFTGSNFAVRVPVYLAPDKKKALLGGIALGYTDKDDAGFGVSVFVGKAFSFFD